MAFAETGCDRTQVPMSLGLVSMMIYSGLNKVSLSLATIQSLLFEVKLRMYQQRICNHPV
jgi:hypothetical protein